MSYHAILRRTYLNGVLIECDKYMGQAPDDYNANNLISLLNDDVKLLQTKTLCGFKFEFYSKYYE